MKLLTTIAILGCAALPIFGQGTILWNEAVNGPLSNDGDHPTALGRLGFGTNSLMGASEQVGAGIYEDYVTFGVPLGMRVTALWLTVDKTVAVWLGNQGFGNEFAYLITPASGDLLPRWSVSSVESGNYGMYVKNYYFAANPSVANYRLDFVVVPEPGTWALLILGSLGLFRHVRCNSVRIEKPQ